jgi:3',5'-cyclic AMP phosphodiesterase CpdA
VAVSGDLTQRARRRQFVRARAFLDRLPTPHVVVPGNHDLPLYNLVARLLVPLRGYTTHITSDLEPTLTDGSVWISGVNTTRPLKWKSGGVDAAALDRLRAAMAAAPVHMVRVLVAHHPFEAARGNLAASTALTELTAAGVDVFLTGHLHTTYTGHTAHRYNVGGRAAVVVEAGTATSTRRRDENNAFNVLRISPDVVEVEVHTWQEGAFVAQSSQRFVRKESGWGAASAGDR